MPLLVAGLIGAALGAGFTFGVSNAAGNLVKTAAIVGVGYYVVRRL